MTRRIALTLAGLLTSCTPAPKVEAPWDPRTHPRPPHAEPEPEPATPTENARRMHEWFVELDALRDAVVAGDRAGLATRAETLAGQLQLTNDVPESWQRHAADLRGPLTRLADPELSLDQAAAALATATATCGACHQDANVVATVEEHLPDTGVPPLTTSSDAVMEQHRWAAARMWEGLVTPSVERWIFGTKAFTLAPGCADESEHAPHSCTHARKIARRGHTMETWPARTALYGELLATCAGCHRER